MKYAGFGWISCIVPAMLSASCGPQVGGIVVEQWTPLAEGAWSLDAGAENPTWCTELTIAEETYISALRPVAPPGTHHVTLNLVSSDDDGGCSAGRLEPETIYAAGPGAGEVRMPSGVAMRIAGGQSVRLNLHVYNATSQPLEGVSGVEIVRAKPDTVRDEAGFVLAGPEKITLPPKQRTTVTQSCSFTADQTAFALIPLMHKLGVQFKTTVTRGGESTVLYDGAFLLEDQTQVPMASLAFRAGDSITVECTYENPTYGFITKGHNGGEICYGALLRYPRGADVDCDDTDDNSGKSDSGSSGPGISGSLKSP